MGSACGWSLWERQESWSEARSMGKLALGLAAVVGLRFLYSWTAKRVELAIGLVAGLGPTVKEPTWEVLLKLLYWATSITIFFVMPKVFLTLLGIAGVVIVWKTRKVFQTAMQEKGLWLGVMTGLWRMVPVLIEPIFFDSIKKKYKDWLERQVKASPPPTTNNPIPAIEEDDPPDPPRKGPRRAKDVKIHIGKDKVSERAVKKWEGKNIPLPHKGEDTYGLKPGQYYIVKYAHEEHDAYDVGLHHDFRWQHPTMNVVDAVALPKAHLPELGKPVLAVKSDAGHGHRVLKNEPFKPTGYGAGHTKTISEGRAILWVDPKSHHLHIITDKNEAFAFVKTSKSGKDEWLMQRLSDSPVGGKPVPHIERKMVFRDLSGDPEKILVVAKGRYVEVKYDGAMYTLKRDKEGNTFLISRRPVHRDNAPVAYGEGHLGINRIYWVPDVQYISEDVLPRDSEIQVEVLSPSRGKYSSSHARTGALLNTGVASSIEQQQKGGKLIVKMLQVDRYDGEDMHNADIFEERKLRESIGRKSHGVLHVPAARFTPEGGYKLYQREVRGKREGVVIRGNVNYKVKAKETKDFQLQGIYPVDPLKRASNVRSRKEAVATRNPGSKWLVNSGRPGARGVV